VYICIPDGVNVKSIPIYHDINQLHAVTGSLLRTGNDMFHCFDMSDINDGMRSLPPYRTDFFSLALSFGSQNFDISINENSFGNLERNLVCVAPGQITSYHKQGAWAGFCTFFKAEFMQYKTGLNFLDDYPFFNIHETNVFPVDEYQRESLSAYYRQILLEQHNREAYHSDIIRASFQAVLWQVRRIYEAGKEKEASDKAALVIASKFQYLVNQFFTDIVFVEQYAEMLNITANHLTQTIKSATGKTAKSIITQRRLEEAKFLLKHTQEDIASIAHHLHFSEPTHFSKFFKKESGCTPLEFRARLAAL